MEPPSLIVIIGAIAGIVAAISGLIRVVIDLLPYIRVPLGNAARRVGRIFTIIYKLLVPVVLVVLFLLVLGIVELPGESSEGTSSTPPENKQGQSGPAEGSGPEPEQSGSSGGPTDSPPKDPEPTTDKPTSDLASDALGLYGLTPVDSGTEFTYPSDYSDYRVVNDIGVVTNDKVSLTVKVPPEWNQTEIGPWEFEGGESVGSSVVASTDVHLWKDPGTVPGASFLVSPTLRTSLEDYSTERILTEYSPTYCSGLRVVQDEYPGESAKLTYRLWQDCGEGGTYLLQLVVEPYTRPYVVRVAVLMVSDADVEATYKMLQTLEINTENLEQD